MNHEQSRALRFLLPWALAGAALSPSGCGILENTGEDDPPVNAQASAVGSGEYTRVFPVVRDTVVEEAHKGNNDGSWGYGWVKVSQGAYNYGLLGFDLSSLAGMTGAQVLSAKLKLRVAQNHFAEDGKAYDIHRIDMAAPAALRNWEEGSDRWDLFSYCSNSEWFRPAEAIGGPGATWTCSNDPQVRDGSLACVSSGHPWAPLTNGGVPAGWITTPSKTITEKKAYSSPADIAEKCPDLLVGGDDCNPTCGESKGCLMGGGTPDECYRTVVVDLTSDVRLFVNAAYWTPSWLIKRQENSSGAGAFHYFSREGAICILGNCGDADPQYTIYRDLRPVLEVVLSDPPSLPLVEPDMHCGALLAECAP